MPEMHVRQPEFTYSACGPFTNNMERIQKFVETGDSQYIYQKELDKACFQHDMVYGDFKDLTRRIASDKILRNKAFDIAKNPKCNGYQREPFLQKDYVPNWPEEVFVIKKVKDTVLWTCYKWS